MKSFLDSKTFKWLNRNRERSNSRFPTFVEALSLLTKKKGKIIVETGTVRQEDDWGAGYSTVIFGRYCKEFGTKLYTIDNDGRHLVTAKVITEEFSDHIEYVLSDSVKALRDFRGEIDLLYLDSVDYPIDWILDRFGRGDWGHSIDEARKMSEEEVLGLYGDIIVPCQEHQLQEMQEAYDKLTPNALILLDDAGMPAGGKVRLSKRFLEENGWKVLLSGQQVLLSR